MTSKYTAVNTKFNLKGIRSKKELEAEYKEITARKKARKEREKAGTSKLGDAAEQARDIDLSKQNTLEYNQGVYERAIPKKAKLGLGPRASIGAEKAVKRIREVEEREKADVVLQGKTQKTDFNATLSNMINQFTKGVIEEAPLFEGKLLRDSKFNKKLILKTLHDYIGAVSSEYEGVIEVFDLTLGMIEDDIQFTREDLINYNDPIRREEIQERFLNTEYETMEIMTKMLVESLDSPSGNGIVEQYVEVDAPNFDNVKKTELPDGTLVYMSNEEDGDGTHKIFDLSTLDYIGGVSLQEVEEDEEDKVIVSAPKETPRTFKKGFGIRRLRKGFGIKRLPKPQGKIANAMVAKGIVRTFSSSEEDTTSEAEDEEIDGFKALPEELQRKLDFALNTDRFTKITNLNLRLDGEEFETIVLLNLGANGDDWDIFDNSYFNFPLAFSDAGAIVGRYDIYRNELIKLDDARIGETSKYFNNKDNIGLDEYDGGYDLDLILNSRELFDSSKLEEYFDDIPVYKSREDLIQEPQYKSIIANYRELEGIITNDKEEEVKPIINSGGGVVRRDEADVLGAGRVQRVRGMMKYQEITNEDEIEANEAFFDRDKDEEELMVYYDDISELFYASWDNNEIITNIQLVGASDEKNKLYYDFI